ncbi:hypothetical protein [Polyangium sp. y55x31]|uniref:hypothetical protein n=1 Tax=Polyangium sp. y55x31 TaxID=3042688 RepID=UPI00248245F8|nr:hypothetical protein [Polyangium sp. y55x31]MDI1484855.1 hypothetical protein [Polyangium sp. y55x31]
MAKRLFATQKLSDLSNKELLETVRLAQQSNSWETQFPSRGPEVELHPNDAVAARAYLKNPTRSGIWRLVAKWESDAGVSKVVWDQISARFGTGEQVAYQIGKQNHSAPIDELNTAQTRAIIANRISFLFELFRYLNDTQSGTANVGDAALSSDTLLILAAIKADKIPPAFAEALEFFSSQINYPEFHGWVRAHRPTTVQGSSFILMDPPGEGKTIKCIALSSKPLEQLRKFLELTGKISSPTLRPVFSPEEEVFEPYFDIVKATHSTISSDPRLNPHFERAFSEYSAERFESTVNALGLIAEDYLTQVYETLLRDVPPRGKTLGQLYDHLHSEVRSLFKKEPAKPADLDSLYGKVNAAIKASDSGAAESSLRTLEVVRDVITAIKVERIFAQDQLRQTRDHDTHVSVFPAIVRTNLNDLIRYRNAAAHKTRVPIGSYEALRTLYSLVSFVTWWQEALANIDWHVGRNEIIAQLVKDAGD